MGGEVGLGDEVRKVRAMERRPEGVRRERLERVEARCERRAKVNPSHSDFEAMSRRVRSRVTA